MKKPEKEQKSFNNKSEKKRKERKKNMNEKKKSIESNLENKLWNKKESWTKLRLKREADLQKR